MEGAIAMRRGEAHPVLERFEGNPILEPDPRHWWESKATFNPGAIYESGKVHILYRANWRFAGCQKSGSLTK